MDLDRNTILYTRDGRKIGNALVYGSTITARGKTYYLVTDDKQIYLYRYEQLEAFFYMKDTRPARNDHHHFDFTGLFE